MVMGGSYRSLEDGNFGSLLPAGTINLREKYKELFDDGYIFYQNVIPCVGPRTEERIIGLRVGSIFMARDGDIIIEDVAVRRGTFGDDGREMSDVDVVFVKGKIIPKPTAGFFF